MKSQVTEEQKKQLRKLQWSMAKNGFLTSSKYIFFLALSSMAVTVIDLGFEVHSQAFRFIGAAISGIFVVNAWRKDLTKEQSRVESEIKKILEQK